MWGILVCSLARHRLACGSPPRVWGILVSPTGDRDVLRFTPTCVGNTWSADSYADWTRRFTPTCVGNTSCWPWRQVTPSVHPHVCGEYMRLSTLHAIQSYGSPPRVWGIPDLSPMPGSRMSTVHPHVCGEYGQLRSTCRACICGSPPRVWGILTRSPVQLASFTVHPHVCGEYRLCLHHGIDASGSPPRVWGIHAARTSVADLMHGSPPRVWGIRCCSWLHCSCVSVHPHVCGEYDAVDGFAMTGSRRFTPTCVGNTLLSTDRVMSPRGSPPRVWGILAVDRLPMLRSHGSPPRVWGILPSAYGTS